MVRRCRRRRHRYVLPTTGLNAPTIPSRCTPGLLRLLPRLAFRGADVTVRVCGHVCVTWLRGGQTIRRDAEGKIIERSILGTAEDLAEPATQQPAPAPSASFASLGRNAATRQSSLRVQASVPSIPSIAEGVNALSRQDESQHSSTLRYEAIEERLRRSQAVRTQELQTREKNMKSMLPHEKVKLLREERARLRWQETQKYALCRSAACPLFPPPPDPRLGVPVI